MTKDYKLCLNQKCKILFLPSYKITIESAKRVRDKHSWGRSAPKQNENKKQISLHAIFCHTKADRSGL
jgi:hypothetical protein